MASVHLEARFLPAFCHPGFGGSLVSYKWASRHRVIGTFITWLVLRSTNDLFIFLVFIFLSLIDNQHAAIQSNQYLSSCSTLKQRFMFLHWTCVDAGMEEYLFIDLVPAKQVFNIEKSLEFSNTIV